MSRSNDRLIAIDGVNGAALAALARTIARTNKRHEYGLSAWDASGVFGEVVVAEDSAGRPSARTLLILYAADLAFRLRWEIRPALEEGLTIVAAPYVDTAMAFGKAAGLDPDWLAAMFSFAPRAGQRRLVTAAPARSISDRKGFVEFSCQQLGGVHAGPSRRLLMRRTAINLKSLAKRPGRPR